ncbi:hypothetical protein COS54_01615 [Candidatus Shapirobacteria bacterium CG03_land_8_20_14_0_80_39_12]|uniref:RNHCP domain-containing protein n=1 Tax=Candidatus Shapirobacteria bacterium CG03_land_8_20_14_0_80_39_12 TaxID=1974879 RepID=A0A2M7BDC9_9BACT|nr:MAG: hypothetical protein COS54_01615 [Candidatus Shapirobacteria bacterium CG03_land_8_20_14_0_80_39_12]PJA08364.1 MAG: hypothetical protein COX69_02535 [Candidatus Falkowbacteria bacterium CG_4_10_14_0_2_um_filter_48_10]
MKKQNFIRQVEDFTCENCGEKVIGNGYTNHCPQCLFSKHVDLETPGDRKSLCLGTMEPIGVELIHREYVIIHRCLKCGKVTKNKAAPEDAFEKILELSKSRRTR